MTSSHPNTSATLEVPGASLYYEVRGSGPVLLIIPGGIADASLVAPFADQLANRYTVVTFDPRGNSRSAFHGPRQDWQVAVHSDDAHRLLAAIGSEPAYVLGSSSGAFVGFDLVARHPEQVRTYVAHEPPLTDLLPDAEHHRQVGRAIYETYRTAGLEAAIAEFMGTAFDTESTDQPGASAEPDPEMAPMMERLAPNWDLFFAHSWQGIGNYMPDFAALRNVPTRIVVAGGQESRGEIAYAAAAAVAERLGTQLVELPGDHGFGSDPVAFAEALHQLLRG